ncbi:organic cation transporter protein [Octopus bimaculoides]|uniref:Major facilitator superfamily (MFS) profile domain-containing protein n=2 Tax=Octopus bimaculoides TaxID=37653 RepID=A0A0L8FY30_OCTBM|nr:organic cation transporter protein [Octopus bimaculoides]|eukprot:XP_014785828.1 PREDICTED: organic cation transporter protein-like isoform X1 [Octopus bimaculoides]
MDSEVIISSIGGFGRYQKIQLAIFSVPWLGGGLQLALAIFILRVPAFRCAIPGWENDTYKVQSDTHAWYINHSLPSDNRKCKVYQFNYSDFNDWNTSKEVNCHAWVYDKSSVPSTAASDLNLVCHRTVFISTINMLLMAGVFVGSLFFGTFSDQKGRKLSLYLALLLSIVTVLPLYFVGSFEALATLRFFAGSSGASIFMVAFILAIEIVPHSHRSLVGLFSHIAFATGQIAMAGIAYLIRDWHLLCLAASLIFLPFFLYWFIIDESPRWLISNSKVEEAKDLFEKIAKRNKAVFTPSSLQQSQETTPQIMDQTKPAQKVSLFHLFKSRVLLIRCAIISFNWIVVNMVFFGLLFGIGELGLNIYFSTFLFAAVEFPAYVFLYFTLDRWGRKPLYCSLILLCGVACVSSSFVYVWGKDLFGLTIFLALIGKFSVSGASTVISNIASEILPTVIRNAAFGLCSCLGRLGGMSAPYITLLSNYIPTEFGKSLPLILFGVAALVAGFLSLALPETLGENLPDTIEDGEKFGR